MPQIINTNIASLNAQRNLNATQRDADTALQRLSSGLRINSAKDDAAGLAISERFQSQITGLNMAQRNANDGISLAQTTEGALDEITANPQQQGQTSSKEQTSFKEIQTEPHQHCLLNTPNPVTRGVFQDSSSPEQGQTPSRPKQGQTPSK